MLERAQQQTIESLSSTSAGGVSGQKWRGGVPYLRIIMCLTQDNVKSLFLTRANMRGHGKNLTPEIAKLGKNK